MQKFFCDNCGTQVKRNETRCPKCGRYFRSVRCPSCGLTGEPDKFTNGCPSCGYAKDRLEPHFDFYDIDDVVEKGTKKNTERKNSFFSDRFYKRAIPVLVIIIIVLFVLLIRTGW